MRGLVWRVRLLLLVSVLAVVGGAVATPATADPGGDPVRVQRLPDGWGGTNRGFVVTYRTPALDGRPTTATGLVFLPDAPAPDGGWPIVAWDHGTNGLGQQCGLTSTAGAPYDSPSLLQINRAGYAAVAPDYLGLSPASPGVHPYQSRRAGATDTIDLVRAARRVFPELSARWGVIGVSEGGHAALSTGYLASEYASELDFRGTAALAPAANLERLIPLARPGMPEIPALDGLTGIVAAVLAGIEANVPGAGIGGYLSPEGRRIVDAVRTQCVTQWTETAANHSVGDLLSRPLDDPAIVAVLNDYLAIPATGYRQPLFIGQGVADTSVPLPLTLALLAELSSAGTRYEFAAFDADHMSIMKDGFTAGLRFLQRALS
ncbi:hypothetical protein IU500_32645 [Nocardia terpenica]|uniref:lipase family protein n=1 Tax=Nocardia terpenica TaxID=455432 RepID=UPI001894DE1C|nr:lipase family protein [Nocardia terpenica]MBF6061020.1 hypothetical protein [Nocardia terpenica]MBF6108768.1 hypothetical protein [Nocardia terpenica]MBF6114046.1 hypothetical protein [Nocardia terpenica]MBF6120330.1 hypothetical protein [Nocardia terpenica]MBF6156359.1 hypothetical protein [Nocardia terpenica]